MQLLAGLHFVRQNRDLHKQNMFILQQMVGLVKERVGKKEPSPKGGQS